jgi:hypothetical protein
MRSNISTTCGIVVALASLPAIAHHSRANFSDEVAVFEAEVTRWEWVNPHVYAYIEALDANGVMTEWEVEMQSTMGLVRRGWSRDSLAVGDIITIRANPDKNPDRKLLFGMTYTKADGSTLSSQGQPRGPADDVPPAESLVGVWSNASWRGAGPRDRAATHLPLTEKAVAAAAGYSENQNPMAQCIYSLPPGNMGGPYLHEVEILDNVILLKAEYNEVTRAVYIDGREHPSDLTPSNQGHSIGWWEGDTLVVDTVGLEEHPWGNGRGIPSSTQRHSVERLTLSEDGRNVQIEYTIEDPEYLTEPVSNSISWGHAPDMQMLPNTCDPEVAGRILN